MLTEISKLDSKSAIKEKSKPSVSHSEEKSQKFSGESDFNGFDQEPENKLTAFNKFLNNLGIDPPTEVSDPLHSKKDVSIDKPDQEDGMVVDNDGDNSIDSGDSDKMEIDIDADKNNTDIESENKATNTENTKHSKDSEEKLPTSGDIVDSVQPTQKMSPVTTNMKGEGGKVEFCGTCDSQVDDAEEGICCDGQCERWFHLRCSGLTKTEYDALGLDENAKWSCGKCSGKPKQPAANQKPLLSVRKDLGPILTPPPALKRRSVNTERKTPKVDIANPAYLKPFDFGWKRELVYRSTNDTQNRRQGDIYYYTPKGKKLRSLREISDHLVGVDLTIDNFTFWKEPLGVDDQAKEIIRDAKLKLVNKDTTASPGIVQKKLLTPKTPKPIKTTPKVTATIAPFEAKSSPKNTPTGTPRVVLKKPVAAATKFKVTPNKAATSTITTTPNRIVIGKAKKLVKRANIINNSKEMVNKNIANDSDPSKISKIHTKKTTTNKFKRFGLLANAKIAQTEGLPTISSHNSDHSATNHEFSPRRTRSKSSDQTDKNYNHAADPLTKSQTLKDVKEQACKEKANKEIPLKTSEKQSNLADQFSTLSNNNLTHSLFNRRANSPEIQFRPSNPSSYGCQTSSSSLTQYQSNVTNSTNIYETVLIVDNSSDKFVNDNESLFFNNRNCPIEIIRVEPISPDSSFADQPLSKADSAPRTSAVESKVGDCPRRSSHMRSYNYSPIPPTPEIIVIEGDDDDEYDGEDDSLPLVLEQTNLIPKPSNNNLRSPNRPPPPLVIGATNLTLPANIKHSNLSLKSQTVSNAPAERIPGDRHLAIRQLKKLRLQRRQKERNDLMKLKKKFLKVKLLSIKRKSVTRALQAQYLRLKLQTKQLKLAKLKKDLNKK